MIPYSVNPLGINKKLTDLDILRRIRDANPTSQLPGLWLDSEDPYAQWEGVTWNTENTKVDKLHLIGKQITNLTDVNKLKSLTWLYCGSNELTSLNLDGLIDLKDLWCSYNQITSLSMEGVESLTLMYIHSNQISSIPSLISKNNIANYNFIYNNFTTAELDRFRALGFTDEAKLLPQN